MNKSNITYSYEPHFSLTNLLASIPSVNTWLSRKQLFIRLAALYSFMLEESVTPMQAVHVFYAQLAAAGILLPMPIGIGWRACFFVLFAMSAAKAFPKKD